MTRYKYTGDYQIPPTGYQDNPSRDGMILQSMQDKHIIGNLVEEQSLIKENDNWNALKGKIIRYGLNNLPKEEYILETTTPLSNFEESQVLEVDNNLHFNDHYKKRITYDKYDTYGNPNQIVKDNFNTTVYLWGYTGQYPIAEIKNATYTEVTTKINATPLENIAAKAMLSVADSATINNLRMQLPNAQVSTYTYKPLVGIRTKTDPRGVKTTYEYDAFGRLQAIKDENNNVIERYDYHYKNQ
jgi:YD repeat-containing protein